MVPALNMKRILPIALVLLIAALLIINWQNGSVPVPDAPAQTAASAETAQPADINITQQPAASVLDEDGVYYTAEDVALYLHTYQKLPKNYITKQEARALGWSGGDLRPYIKDHSIGGDRFGNYEGLLPKKPGRVYYECDIDAQNKASRGAKRIVYSNDGLVYYTFDHYESFTLLYGEE